MLCADGLLLDSAQAQAWQWSNLNTNAGRYWGFIATSADGNVLCLENVSLPSRTYFSTNSGNTWTGAYLPNEEWSSLAASGDGSKIFAVSQACDGQIYATTNAGLNWTTNSIPGLNSVPNRTNSVWASIATSADGTKWAVATATNWVYVTSDSGMTWTSNSLPNVTSQALLLRCSADGTKLVVAGTLSPVWVSTNSGAAWTAPVNAPSGPWQAIASSADGSKVFLVGLTNLMYRSYDYGFTWQSNSVPGVTYWSGIASSADGIKLAAVAPGSSDGNGTPGVGVFISTNAGTTWALDTNQLIYPPSAGFPPGSGEGLINQQLGIASSADGSKLVLISGINYTVTQGLTYGSVPSDWVWTSYTPPSPRLQISAPGTNLVLSWTAGSFVLEFMRW